MTQASDLIDRFRGGVEDWGVSLTDQFMLTANDPSGTVYQLSNGPIKSLPLPVLTDNSTLKTYGTHFTVNFNNNELTVLYTQTSGHVLTVSYTKVLYRDERVIGALGDGVRRMYPYVYKTGEAYLAMTTQQWTYDLASPTDVPDAATFPAGTCPSDYVAAIARADLVKPQARIHSAQYLPVGGASTMAWVPFYDFQRTTARDLSTTSPFNPGDTVKLVYSAPCTPPATSDALIDVPDAYIDLPVWYAMGMLAERKESVRIRSDSLATQNTLNANPNGVAMSAGNSYLQLFWTTLRQNPMRPLPTTIRRHVPGYARNYP